MSAQASARRRWPLGKNPHFRSRKGAILVLSAFLMVFLMAIIAFAVDLGYIMNVQSELKRAHGCGSPGRGRSPGRRHGQSGNPGLRVHRPQSGRRKVVRGERQGRQHRHGGRRHLVRLPAKSAKPESQQFCRAVGALGSRHAHFHAKQRSPLDASRRSVAERHAVVLRPHPRAQHFRRAIRVDRPVPAAGYRPGPRLLAIDELRQPTAANRRVWRGQPGRRGDQSPRDLRGSGLSGLRRAPVHPRVSDRRRQGARPTGACRRSR